MKNGILILFSAITVFLLGYAFYQAMYVAPTEATMGDIQRIFYYHVSSAVVAMACFFANFIFSIWYLAVRRDPLRAPNTDAWAVASAEVGILFCSVVLITGPLWAKPAWGIWWTWDARLTSTLVMWLIYISYLIVRRMAVGEQGGVIAAVLAIFAFLDVPIVYMANRWWRTQHPAPVYFGGENSGADPRITHALLINMLAFACLGLLWVMARRKIEQMRQDIRRRQIHQALHSTGQGTQ